MSNSPTVRQPRLPRAERRAQLLDAAHGVFSERGYHAAAMDDIAEAAKVSKPVLYQHFPGKRELYLALFDREVDTLKARLVGAVSDTADNKERVVATVRVFFDYVAQDSGSHRLIFQSDLANDAEVSARLSAFEQAIGTAIGRIIEGQAGLAPDAATLLGHALAGAAKTAAQRWLEDPSVPLETASELVSRLAWRGIGGYPKEAA